MLDAYFILQMWEFYLNLTPTWFVAGKLRYFEIQQICDSRWHFSAYGCDSRKLLLKGNKVMRCDAVILCFSKVWISRNYSQLHLQSTSIRSLLLNYKFNSCRMTFTKHHFSQQISWISASVGYQHMGEANEIGVVIKNHKIFTGDYFGWFR